MNNHERFFDRQQPSQFFLNLLWQDDECSDFNCHVCYLLVFACCWFVCLHVCVSSFFDLSSSLLVMALSRTWVDWQTWDIYVWDVAVHDWVLVPGAPQVFQWMDGH